MIRRLAVIFLALLASGSILLISLFRNASIRYAFTAPSSDSSSSDQNEIDYSLAYPGSIQPDSPFWPVKVVRDKLWIAFAFSPTKKAELNLLIADKRLGAAQILFQKDKANLGYSTLTKSEKYLEIAGQEAKRAQSQGQASDELLQKIALSALKHLEVSEQILSIAPDDAKPQIILTMNTTKEVYKFSQNVLLSRGISAPKNPFDWN